MMKKLRSLLMAVLMIMSLSACGGEAEQEERLFETGDVQALVDAGVFSEELEELDADVAFALYHLGDYGLEREDLLEAAVVRSAGATCEEAAVLIFGTDDAKLPAQAQKALEDYIDSQVENNEDYRPDEIPKLEQAIVECRQGHVVLVVANNAEKAGEILEMN